MKPNSHEYPEDHGYLELKFQMKSMLKRLNYLLIRTMLTAMINMILFFMKITTFVYLPFIKKMIEKSLKIPNFYFERWKKKCICNEKAVIVPEVENNCHVCSHK